MLHNILTLHKHHNSFTLSHMTFFSIDKGHIQVTFLKNGYGWEESSPCSPSSQPKCHKGSPSLDHLSGLEYTQVPQRQTVIFPHSLTGLNLQLASSLISSFFNAINKENSFHEFCGFLFYAMGMHWRVNEATHCMLQLLYPSTSSTTLTRLHLNQRNKKIFYLCVIPQWSLVGREKT